MQTILRSQTKTVTIGDDQPFCIIGERINPTGRKLFQQQLRDGDLSQVLIDIEEQIAGLDPVTRAGVVARLTADAAKSVRERTGH